MQQSDELRYYLGILRRRYPYFVAAFVAVFCVALVVAVALPPIYRSEAKVLVESQQIPSDLVRSTVTAFALERIEVTRQRITAREPLVAIADKYGLFAEERAKLSVSDLVDQVRQRISILPYDLSLVGQGSRGLTIAFTVGFEYEQPAVAAQVTNELVTLILNEDIRSRTSKAAETTQFLEREAKRLQEELIKTEVSLTEFKQTNRDALPERVAFQMSALERAEDNRKSLDREINDLSEAKRLLTLELSVRQAAAQSGNPQDTGQIDPFRQLEFLRSELSQKSVLYAVSHPEIKAIKGQIAALEKQIAAIPKENPDGAKMSPDELKKLDLNSRIAAEKLDTIERQLALYAAQKTSIFKAITDLTAILTQAPEVQIKLSLIERQRDGLQKQLDEISGKLSEARLGEQLERDQQGERFQIIEQPITPQDPVRPNRKKIITFGFFLAGLAGVGLAGGLEFLNQSIRSSKDLVSALNRHPLVVIPYIRTAKEGRRRLGRILLAVILAVALAAIGLAALHYLYMPLDVLVAKVLTRLGFRGVLDYL